MARGADGDVRGATSAVACFGDCGMVGIVLVGTMIVGTVVVGTTVVAGEDVMSWISARKPLVDEIMCSCVVGAKPVGDGIWICAC